MLALQILLFVVQALIGLGSIVTTSLLALNIGFMLNTKRALIFLVLAWLVNIVLTFVIFYISLSLSWLALLLLAYTVVANGIFVTWILFES
jgi:hypothetical protein